MAVMEYIDAIRLAMKEEMEQDETVFVLGEDVGVKGGVFTTTKGLMEQFGEMRVMDTPLAESAIAGRSDRGGHVRHEACCRDAVFRFHAASNEPNHQ